MVRYTCCWTSGPYKTKRTSSEYQVSEFLYLEMKRVKSSDLWTVMCSNESFGVSDFYDDEFEQL